MKDTLSQQCDEEKGADVVSTKEALDVWKKTSSRRGVLKPYISPLFASRGIAKVSRACYSHGRRSSRPAKHRL